MSQRKSDAASAHRGSRARAVAPAHEAPAEPALTTTSTAKVIDANDAALALLCVRNAQVVGKPLAVFVDMVDRTAFRERLRAVLEDGGCEDWRLSLRRPDGGSRSVVATVEPASAAEPGDTRCDLRWTFRIDTDAVPKVERNAVDELIGRLAHDLNQPLAAIVSYARGCQLRVGANTLKNEDLELILEQIIAEALRAGATIREFRRKDP